MVARWASSATGLMRKAANSSSSDRRRSSSPVQPVRAMSRPRAPQGRARIYRAGSKPSIPGIPRSRMATSGGDSSAAARAAGPSWAVFTRWPCRPSSVASAFTVSRSSSTTRMSWPTVRSSRAASLGSRAGTRRNAPAGPADFGEPSSFLPFSRFATDLIPSPPERISVSSYAFLSYRRRHRPGRKDPQPRRVFLPDVQAPSGKNARSNFNAARSVSHGTAFGPTQRRSRPSEGRSLHRPIISRLTMVKTPPHGFCCSTRRG